MVSVDPVLRRPEGLRKATSGNRGMIEKPPVINHRLVRFGTVGVVTFAVFYALVFVLVEFVTLDILYATPLSYIAAVLLNYGLHHAFTFESATAHDYSVPRYLAVIVAGCALNQALMYFGVRVVGLHYLVVQFAAMCIIVVANYLAFHLWAFAKSAP